MDKILLSKIKDKKQTLLQDGFEIVGVFGSFATNTETSDSDIDLLYDIKPKFLEQYGGFQAFARLNEIKKELKKYLERDVDLATIDSHSKTFKKYALKNVIYV